MALDATVGGSSSNAYVDSDYVDDYMLNRAFAESWDDIEDKDTIIILSSSMIDWYINWKGFKASSEQSMDWPRTDVTLASGQEVDEDAVPKDVKTAVCELSHAMMDGDKTQDWELQGFKVAKVGSLELEIDGSSDNPAPNSMPQRIYKILSDLMISGGINGAVTVRRLVRA